MGKLKELGPTDRFDAERMTQLGAMIDRQEFLGMRGKMDCVSGRVKATHAETPATHYPREELEHDVAQVYTRARVAEQLLRGLVRLILSEDIHTNGNPYRLDELCGTIRFLTGDPLGDV